MILQVEIHKGELEPPFIALELFVRWFLMGCKLKIDNIPESVWGDFFFFGNVFQLSKKQI